jgi:hypothetical protein
LYCRIWLIMITKKTSTMSITCIRQSIQKQGVREILDILHDSSIHTPSN